MCLQDEIFNCILFDQMFRSVTPSWQGVKKCYIEITVGHNQDATNRLDGSMTAR